MASLLPEMCLSSRPMLKWQLHHTVYNYHFETRGRPRFWNRGLLLHRLEEVKSLNRMNPSLFQIYCTYPQHKNNILDLFLVSNAKLEIFFVNSHVWTVLLSFFFFFFC